MKVSTYIIIFNFNLLINIDKFDGSPSKYPAFKISQLKISYFQNIPYSKYTTLKLSLSKISNDLDFSYSQY